MIPSSSSLRRSYNYYDDPYPNSRPQEDPPPFVLDHFPSPFLDHHDHNQLLFFTHGNINSPQSQQLKAHDEHIHGGACINIPADKNTQDISMNITHDDHPTPSSKVLAPKMIEKSSSYKGAAKKQRKSGKDRHSKICTAQGIRDRRMRLSLHIAFKFFDLQDMLGFDKASKTTDWLFSKSKKAIKKLSCTTTNHLPQINMISTNTTNHNNTTPSEQSDSSMSSECEVESEGENVSGEREARKSQTAAYGNNPINTRETRDKARARAKERTRKKMMIRCLEKSPHYYLSDQTSASAYNLAKLGSSAAPNPNSIFETVHESSVRSQERTNSTHEYSSYHASLHPQMDNVGIVASSSTAPAVSCSIFDYQKNDALFSGGLDSYSNKFLG